MSADLADLLRDFYLERVALLMRHEEVARRVPDYDINNAYQYIVNREETHLSWLQHALLDLGAPLPVDPLRPTVADPGRGEGYTSLISEDARANQAFVEAWRPRVAEITHARHRGMLEVILGETLEHKRFFDQGAAGRTDLIGIPMPGTERRGIVHPDRWIE